MRTAMGCAFLLASASVYPQPLPPPFRNGPPQEARLACADMAEGAGCSFQTLRGLLEGSCRAVPEGFACVAASRMGAGDAPQGGGRRAPHGVDIAADNPAAMPVHSRIPDTNQGTCFDDQRPVPCPARGQPYFGQDAQYLGARADYQANGDGTVTDRVTGLLWQQADDGRARDWPTALAYCTSLRLPNVKELQSIVDYRRSDPALDERFLRQADGPEITMPR